MTNELIMNGVASVLKKLCDGDVDCAKRKLDEFVKKRATIKETYLLLLSELWAKKFIEHVGGAVKARRKRRSN